MKSVAERVLGVSRLNEPGAMQTAYGRLTGREWLEQEFKNECSRLEAYDIEEWDQLPPDVKEDRTTLFMVQQTFGEGQVRPFTTLKDWPAYEAAYRNVETSMPDGASNWALQVGCFTAVSSAGFAALSREVYNAEPLTIDLSDSPARISHPHYAITDALTLGIADNSIKLAQTNHLFHKLQTPADSEPKAQILNVLNEMYRVLKPGGYVLLREITPGLDYAENPTYESQASQDRIAAFKEELSANLLRIGFTSIIMKTAVEIDGVDYLFDASRDFSRYKADERPGIAMISAQKPEA